MVKDSINNFLYYDNKPFQKKTYVKCIFVNIVFSIMVCVFGKSSLKWFIIMAILNILYIAIVIMICGDHVPKNVAKNAGDGVSLLFLSIVMTLIGYRFFMQTTSNSFLLLLILFFLLFIGDLMMIGMSLYNIKHDKYRQKHKHKIMATVPMIGGFLGISLGKFLFQTIQTSLFEYILGIMFMISALACCYGCVPLLKVILLLRQSRKQSEDGTKEEG